MLYKKYFKNKAFTLIETLVSVAVFLIISIAAYQAYISLFTLINQNQYKILAISLANEQFEIIRNLTYTDVGILGGIPNGKLSHIQNLTRGNVNFTVTTTIRNIDLPFDGTIGSTTKRDLSPADNKLAEVEVTCANCKNFSPVKLTTTVSPKNLETASTNGALLIKVFDSNGTPVSNANVHILNTLPNPDIVIDDVTDNDGLLMIVDAPPGTNAYQISVTKSGYSTDRTYTPGAGNPTPTKPDATVVVQQLTQISFSIDKLSTLNFSSVTSSCVPVPNIDFTLKGGKLIGTNIPKYSQNLLTNGSGIYTNTTMESDAYTVIGIDSAYDFVGINPLNPISLNSNSTQNVSLIVMQKNPRSLLVTVKDNTTKLPITGATVKVTKGTTYNVTKITGRGYIYQTDWSLGDGQNNFSDNASKYFSDSGSIEISNPVGDLKLKKVFENYNLSGWLESSTIDTGSASNFYNLSWSPVDQPIRVGPDSVKMQFASSTTPPTTWEFKGPDGTSNTYYTLSNSTLSSIHNGDRYVRYKIFLNTESSTSTPNVSDISFTDTSSCTPPGQVVFSGLETGTYHLEISKDGYSSYTLDVNVNTSWIEKEIILSE